MYLRYLQYRNSKQLLLKFFPIIIAYIFGFFTTFLYFILVDRNQEVQLTNLQLDLSELHKQESTFLIVIIFSAPNNEGRRNVIRETWLKFSTHRRVKHYFVIGTKSESIDIIKNLNKEYSKYEDILLLSHLSDTYERLTAKLIESFKWISRKQHFEYLLKVDDDSFVRLDKLYDEIVEKNRKYTETRLLYWGYFDGRAYVKRQGPWKEMSWFLCDRYLPYALGGGYLLSQTLVDYVVTNSELFKMYKNEDVSLGVWLAPLAIIRIHDLRFDTEYQSRGCIESYLIQHKQSIVDMRSKFTSIQTQGQLCLTGQFERKFSYDYNWNVLPSKCCFRNVTMMKID